MERDEDGFPIPRKQFMVSDEHGDSTYVFAVFHTAAVRKMFPELMGKIEPELNVETAMTDSQFKNAANELAATLTGMHAFSRGPGRAFGMRPLIRIGKHNIVVRQFRALDI